MKKQSLHSCMRHSAFTCSIILQSTIKIYQLVTEIKTRDEVKIWIRGNALNMKTSRY